MSSPTCDVCGAPATVAVSDYFPGLAGYLAPQFYYCAYHYEWRHCWQIAFVVIGSAEKVVIQVGLPGDGS